MADMHRQSDTVASHVIGCGWFRGSEWHVCNVSYTSQPQLQQHAALPSDWHMMQAEDSVIEQVQAEKDGLLAELRRQMAHMQRQHDSIAAELQGKLQW